MGSARLGEHDEVLAAVSLIHAAGGDAARWPEALAAVTRLIGGAAATFEVFDKSTFSHREFHGFNIPRAEEIAYLAGHVTNNPRWDMLMPGQKSGDVGWDYQFIDEARMNKEPFYAAFLAALDMRYFLSGVLTATPEEYAVISVQRAPRQGHVERREIDLMTCLLPHVRHAFEISRRLAALTERHRDFRSALDWLTDGVLMLAADQSVRYVNATAQEIMRRADVFCLRNGALVFRSTGAATKFGKAMEAIVRLKGLDPAMAAHADFIIERGSDEPPLAVSLRPLPAAREGAVALMFIHDPSVRRDGVAVVPREAFGLTPAEADMAAALCAGVSPDNYARGRQLSRNTVYTHLRRIKEKTGCTRLPELIHKLNDTRLSAVRRAV
jgi:DNA-binding CsgD family transcriptional regulator/PAS domain-containing protein